MEFNFTQEFHVVEFYVRVLYGQPSKNQSVTYKKISRLFKIISHLLLV